jgi:hypothetical protein
MFKFIGISFCFIGLLSGCSEYRLQNIPEDPFPEIEVTPEEHNFGALDANGGTGELIILISNVGTGELDLNGVSLLDGDATFALGALPPSRLYPGETAELIVTYDPKTYEDNTDVVSILSNDEDESTVLVPLGGSGDAPVIRVSPEYFDFGTLFLGCDDDLEVSVENIGNTDLEINDVEYFASVPVDFSLEDHELAYGPLPWVLPPGDSMSLDVNYQPLDVYDDSAYIEITSNDPVNTVSISEHDGLGDYESYITDNFEQDGTSITDILFVIDNSGSMSSNQTNFKNNFDSFIAVFSAAGVDYQIAFITTDNENFVNSTIVTSSSADPVGDVNDIVDSIGVHGSAYERGLYYSYLATQPGADAGHGSAFLRSGAKLVVIYVSDEPDYSSSLVSTSDVSSHLTSLKSSGAMVTAHAVAGDYPSGCSANGGASFGSGYYDVVNDLGGTFMSICASDYGAQMDTLARESMALMSFDLSGTPIESTIEVFVDGAANTDWTYDSSLNAIIFNVAPTDGSLIDVSYAIWADCASDDTGDTGQ